MMTAMEAGELSQLSDSSDLTLESKCYPALHGLQWDEWHPEVNQNPLDQSLKFGHRVEQAVLAFVPICPLPAVFVLSVLQNETD